MHEIERSMVAIKGRWMTGMEAASAAPPAWKPMLDGQGDAELRLLALMGQVTRVAMRPVPGEALVPPPLLPVLALPGMPEPARIRFRQVMTNRKGKAEEIAPALYLAAARGYAVHPADWMPGTTDTTAPALYAPWIDWLGGAAGQAHTDVLTAETWDTWYPSERRAALATMRCTDPAAARSLIAAKAGDVAAEERVKLVTILAKGLSDADAEFLETLAKDRSGKVKTLAANLLARLGRGEGSDEDVAELADMLEMTGGVLRKKTFGPKKLKNDVQRKRRDTLFAQVPLARLAGAFDLSQAQATALWDMTRDARATRAFAGMVAASGADAVQAPLARRLFEAGYGYLAAEALTARLTRHDRAAMLPEVIAHDGPDFAPSLDMAGADLGGVSMAVLARSDGMKTLTTALKTALRAQSDDWRTNTALAQGMRALGLLADHATARALLEQFIGLGLISADPRLDLLHFNAALPQRTDP